MLGNMAAAQERPPLLKHFRPRKNTLELNNDAELVKRYCLDGAGTKFVTGSLQSTDSAAPVFSPTRCSKNKTTDLDISWKIGFFTVFYGIFFEDLHILHQGRPKLQPRHQILTFRYLGFD